MQYVTPNGGEMIASIPDFVDLSDPNLQYMNVDDQVHIDFHQMFSANAVTRDEAYLHPHALLVEPVFSRMGDPESQIVGIILYFTFSILGQYYLAIQACGCTCGLCHVCRCY